MNQSGQHNKIVICETLLKQLITYQRELQEGIARITPQTELCMLQLAEEGWYIFPDDLDFQQINEIACIKNKDVFFGNNFNNLICETTELERLLISRFPEREKCFIETFEAHQTGKYYLSIPAFFLQTDGITHDLISGHVFRSDNGRPSCSQKLLDYIEHNKLSMALAAPILTKTNINKTEKQRTKDFNSLNRHLVMHGESTDYGTKTNSLKAISLLNFVYRTLSKAIS
jgi:hypothetical protein